MCHVTLFCLCLQELTARAPSGGPLTVDDFSPLRVAFEDRDTRFVASPVVQAFTQASRPSHPPCTASHFNTDACMCLCGAGHPGVVGDRPLHLLVHQYVVLSQNSASCCAWCSAVLSHLAWHCNIAFGPGVAELRAVPHGQPYAVLYPVQLRWRGLVYTQLTAKDGSGTLSALNPSALHLALMHTGFTRESVLV